MILQKILFRKPRGQNMICLFGGVIHCSVPYSAPVGLNEKVAPNKATS